jgi:hypothetical protein
MTYNGRMFGKFDLSTSTNHIDSLAIAATDGDGVSYKIGTIGRLYPNLAPTCNYFNSGVINVDLTINSVLTGELVYDYGYVDQSSAAYVCDNLGAIYAYSYINKAYQQFYQFIAKCYEKNE